MPLKFRGKLKSLLHKTPKEAETSLSNPNTSEAASNPRSNDLPSSSASQDLATHHASNIAELDSTSPRTPAPLRKETDWERNFNEVWAGPLARQMRYNPGQDPLPGEEPLSEDERQRARGLAQMMAEAQRIKMKDAVEGPCARATEKAKMNNGKGPGPF